MKKFKGILLLVVMSLLTLTACNGANSVGATNTAASDAENGVVAAVADVVDAGKGFNADKDITVVSREDGSGTRGAFIELFGVEVKNDDGTRKDMTTKEAIIAKQTDVMMTNVVGDNYAIGYISLGSLNDTVKALEIEGVVPTADNVKNGSYTVSRPFNIATMGEPTGLAKDFIDFIMSADGQAVVGGSYIAIDDNSPAYSGSGSGKIVVAGSSSVTPIMEKLKEAYVAINTGATIEIQMSDSSAGITGAIDGTCDIGMASRDLKDSELEKLTPIQIALDGIAVIVNHANPQANLSTEQVRAIFTGEVLKWSEIN